MAAPPASFTNAAAVEYPAQTSGSTSSSAASAAAPPRSHQRFFFFTISRSFFSGKNALTKAARPAARAIR